MLGAGLCFKCVSPRCLLSLTGCQQGPETVVLWSHLPGCQQGPETVVLWSLFQAANKALRQLYFGFSFQAANKALRQLYFGPSFKAVNEALRQLYFGFSFQAVNKVLRQLSFGVCLQVVNKVLAVQPQAFVLASAEPLNLLIDACFKVKQQSVTDDLTRTLKTIYTLFPLDKPDNPAQVRALLQQCWTHGHAFHAVDQSLSICECHC